MKARKGFFDYLGTVDAGLWSGPNAGFTQVNYGDSPVRHYMFDNSMLFLIGSVSKQRFFDGISTAVSKTTGTTYSPLKKAGKPTTAKAGAAFPGNDWVAFPNGDGYLSAIGSSSPELLKSLSDLRNQHLHAGEGSASGDRQGKFERLPQSPVQLSRRKFHSLFRNAHGTSKTPDAASSTR